jgi:hypothetical protein
MLRQVLGDVGSNTVFKRINHVHGGQLQDKKNFEIILVLAIQGWQLGSGFGWEAYAEEISTGMWEARMHRY